MPNSADSLYSDRHQEYNGRLARVKNNQLVTGEREAVTGIMCRVVNNIRMRKPDTDQKETSQQ
jgi:hypothetical protein